MDFPGGGGGGGDSQSTPPPVRNPAGDLICCGQYHDFMAVMHPPGKYVGVQYFF